MSESSTIDAPRSRIPWWREKQLLLVLLLAAMTYCLRVSDLQLFGEEPRRALIAREMVESGDWLVPGTQRVFLPSRPPLQNWLIAVAGFFTGSIDIWAARLPSILLTITVSVMIYGYLRQTIEKVGSAAGAVSYLTMQLVMEFGRSAETEAVFTSFVAASLFLWHWAWMKKCPAWKMWSIGYACAALGMLTKGLQAPVYFTGTTVLYLLLTGNWRSIATRGHITGILVFCLIFGAWQLPFTWERGISDSWNIYFADVAYRFREKSWSRFLSHLVSYPAELLFVRAMPWCVLLLAFASRRIRERLGHRRDSVTFLATGILFSFMFVWLPTGSKVRYYMPLFPSFAALVGIAVDCLVAERNETGESRLWTSFAKTSAYLMVGTAVVVLITSLALPSMIISLPIARAFGFTVVTLGLAYVTRSSLKLSTDRAMVRGVYSVGLFCSLVQLSLVMVVTQRRCEDIAGHVERVRLQIPSDARVVSLGQLHHAFAYFFRRPIEIVSPSAKDLPEGVQYFCVHRIEPEAPKLPFEWTQIAEVPVDRFKEIPIPKERVYVGRIATGHHNENSTTQSAMN